MCRAAHETSTGVPCRCSRPDGQFTRREADQRTRSRAMNAMADSLNDGNVATATRAATRAASAQERLDLMADPDALPHIDMFVNKSEIARVEQAIADFRRDNPESTIRYEISEHYAARGGDMSVVNSWAKITVYEADVATLPNRLSVPRDLNLQPDVVLSSYEVLAIGMSAIETKGFVKKGDDGATSETVLSALRAKLGERTKVQQLTGRAMTNMVQAREYLMMMDAKTDFEKRVKAAAQKEFVTPEEVATLTAGANIYSRHLDQEEARARSAAAAAERRERVANPVGNWLGTEGLWTTARARIERTSPVKFDDGFPVRWVVNMRTENGDHLKVFSSVNPGVEGDWLTISGPVVEHSEFNGTKETVFGDSSWEGNGKSSWEFV